MYVHMQNYFTELCMIQMCVCVYICMDLYKCIYIDTLTYTYVCIYIHI